jgi:hypothetical protein
MNRLRRRVVLSWGMGADSTALLLRWIRQPETQPCDLRDLLLITAMTGDEWPATQCCPVSMNWKPIWRNGRSARWTRGGWARSRVWNGRCSACAASALTRCG